MASFWYRLRTFDNRFKLPLHLVILVLIIAVMVISGVRALVKTGPITRSDTMALAMGSKSLIVIAYQLLTEHTRKFRKWASLKANTILNGLEIVFWSAVCFLGMQGLFKSCNGTACALGWVSMVLAIFVTKFESYMFMISFMDFRYFKKNGKVRGHSDAVEQSTEFAKMPERVQSEGVPRPSPAHEHRHEHRRERSHGRQQSYGHEHRYEHRREHRREHSQDHSHQQAPARYHRDSMV